jgi:hypothetical protein
MMEGNTAQERMPSRRSAAKRKAPGGEWHFIGLTGFGLVGRRNDGRRGASDGRTTGRRRSFLTRMVAVASFKGGKAAAESGTEDGCVKPEGARRFARAPNSAGVRRIDYTIKSVHCGGRQGT